eukprot:753079-Prymnesium_polylepis.1
MTAEPDVPFSIEYRVGLELDRSKFREACRKINEKAACMDRVRAITLLAPGEAEIRCKCGATRIARSRPAGKSGQLGGAMNQYWKEHQKTCSYGSPSSTRATDGDGMPLFYAREFPIDAKRLLHDLTDFTIRDYDIHARKMRPFFLCQSEGSIYCGYQEQHLNEIRPGCAYFIVSDILGGNVPIRAESISEENIADVILENVEHRESMLKKAEALVTGELDRLLGPEHFGSVKRRPVPHDQQEDEKVLTDALCTVLDVVRTKNPKCYKCLCEHALVHNGHRSSLSLVSNLLHAAYTFSDAFDDALEARLRNDLRELRKTFKS